MRKPWPDIGHYDIWYTTRSGRFVHVKSVLSEGIAQYVVDRLNAERAPKRLHHWSPVRHNSRSRETLARMFKIWRNACSSLKAPSD